MNIQTKKIVTALIIFLSINSTSLFANDIVQIEFTTAADEPIVNIVQGEDSLVTVTFNDLTLTSIFSNYIIKSCKRAYPSILQLNHPLSNSLYRVYSFVLLNNGNQLIQQLNSYTGNSITYKNLISQPELLYTPNDYLVDQKFNTCPPSTGQPLSHLELIKAREAWDISKGSAGIKIGISDRGFNFNHQDLIGKFEGGNAWPPDPFFHATIVSGFAGANTDNGVGVSSIGFNTKLRAYRAFDYNELINAAIDGCKIINLSWGGCGYDSRQQSIINVLHDYGITIVAAAGNGTFGANCGTAESLFYPASYNHVISVTGVGHYASITTPIPEPCYGKINHEDVHYFKSQNGSPLVTLTHNFSVDVSAPGYEMYSIYGPSNASYFFATGTSFASPIVSGLCALIISINPNFTPDDVEAILKCSARDVYEIKENSNYFNKLGTGRINAENALLLAQTWTAGTGINTHSAPTDVLFYVVDKNGSKTYISNYPDLLNYEDFYAEAVGPNNFPYKWIIEKRDFAGNFCDNNIVKYGKEINLSWATDLNCPNAISGIACEFKLNVRVNSCVPSPYFQKGSIISGFYCTGNSTNTFKETQISELTQQNFDITVSPNPVNNYLTLSVPEKIARYRYTVEIINSTGRVSYKTSLTGKSNILKIDNLSKGLNFILVKSMATTYQVKFLKL